MSYHIEARVSFVEEAEAREAATEIAGKLPKNYRLVEDMSSGEFIILVKA